MAWHNGICALLAAGCALLAARCALLAAGCALLVGCQRSTRVATGD
jgi:hypothetical protein